jgi:hypothetical protein
MALLDTMRAPWSRAPMFYAEKTIVPRDVGNELL